MLDPPSLRLQTGRYFFFFLGFAERREKIPAQHRLNTALETMTFNTKAIGKPTYFPVKPESEDVSMSR